MTFAATSVFLLIFILVTVLGFVAAHWRKRDLNSLHEWGLAGRSFGTLISWFLIGGDIHTAYTFIAVPALMFGAGAIGFFAVPYTIIIYPMAYLILPKLWSVCRHHGYVTAADFVRARFGCSKLALVIALTGIVATMPYIALQLVGIQVVIGALGFPTEGFISDIPLIIAFLILAAYTYSSGMRAPALIAIVKDTLIYLTIVVALIIIPKELGGFEAIFAKVAPEKLLLTAPDGHSTNGFTTYATLALGSAFALFLYPHTITAVLSSNSGNTLRRNTILLPLYTLLLGLIALLGYMALAADVENIPEYAGYFAEYKTNFAVPALFLSSFPQWFVGVAFGAVAIGALVPAAIMSIAAANMYARNIYREFINPECSHEQETQVAKIVSLLVKVGALAFVIFLPQQFAIQLQLLGGIWICQTLPAVFIGLFTRWFDYRALICGWFAGIAFGTWAAYTLAFKSTTYTLELAGYSFPGYAAFYALILNIAVAAVATLLVRMAGLQPGIDQTQPSDYEDKDLGEATPSEVTA
jgi:solute:Na+ symporter, SSS family